MTQTEPHQAKMTSSSVILKHLTQSRGPNVTGSIDETTTATDYGLFVSDGEEGGKESWNLLWMPYVLLTTSVILLLMASFARFHWKNKERYRKRLTEPSPNMQPSTSMANDRYPFGRQVSRARIVYNTNSIPGRSLVGVPIEEEGGNCIQMASLSPLQDGVSVATGNAQCIRRPGEGNCHGAISNGGGQETINPSRGKIFWTRYSLWASSLSVMLHSFEFLLYINGSARVVIPASCRQLCVAPFSRSIKSCTFSIFFFFIKNHFTLAVSQGTEPGTSSSEAGRPPSSFPDPSVEETKWVAMRQSKNAFFNFFKRGRNTQGIPEQRPSGIIPEWRTNMNDRWRAKRPRKAHSVWSIGGGGGGKRSHTRVKLGRL